MKTRNDIFRGLVSECEQMMKECGFTLPRIQYLLNPKKINRLGMCSKNRRTGAITIEVTQDYFDKYLAKGDFHSIKDTILHEMCHALPNGNGHGVGWQKNASIVNKKFGFDIKRLASCDDVVRSVFESKIKYVLTCQKCGQEYKYQKKSPTVAWVMKFPFDGRYTCGCCNGELRAKQIK